MIPRLGGGATEPPPSDRAPASTPVTASSAPAGPVLPLASEVVPGMPGSDRNYALAALLTALGGVQESFRTAGEAAVTAFRHGGGAVLPGVQDATLLRLLHALPVQSTGEDGARALRERVEASGMFLEARLRLILERLPAASAQQALDALPPDLRVLMSSGEATAAARRIVALARKAGEDAQTLPPRSLAGGDPQASASPAATEQQAVEAGLLKQQVEVAYRWVHDGTFVFEFAVRLAAEEARALVEFEPERAAAGGEEGPTASSVRIQIESRVFGPIAAEARWRQTECNAMFYVASSDAFAALTGELPSLREALSGAFPRLAVEVVIDEVRAARRPPALRPDPPPGGSVVSVRT
jgi:hypothetical protein